MRRTVLFALTASLIAAATAGATAAPLAARPPAAVNTTGSSEQLDVPGLTCENPSGATGFVRECPVLHPGDPVSLGEGTRCTLNFLWRGSDGHRYMGTAGHCAHKTDLGGRVASGSGSLIGRLAYEFWDTRSRGADFALVRLDRAVKASPQVQHWGGPTGLYLAMTDQPQILRMAGQAAGLSYIAPDRELLATAVTQPQEIRFLGPVSGNDSGAPVTTETGLAVGWTVELADSEVPLRTSPSNGVEVGGSTIVRIDPAVRLAEKALGIRLTLQKAPLRD